VDGRPRRILLKRPASSSELTVCLGSAGENSDGWFRTLRNLTPRLNPEMAEPAGASMNVPLALEAAYAARCADGPWPILASDLHNAVVPASAPAPSHAEVPSRSSTYKVRSGDTLISIVSKLRCSSVGEIAKVNHLRRHEIRVGQVLKVPGCG
jgi:membrane-bound lytic murein transglycosylase D